MCSSLLRRPPLLKTRVHGDPSAFQDRAVGPPQLPPGLGCHGLIYVGQSACLLSGVRVAFDRHGTKFCTWTEPENEADTPVPVSLRARV